MIIGILEEEILLLANKQRKYAPAPFSATLSTKISLKPLGPGDENSRPKTLYAEHPCNS